MLCPYCGFAEQKVLNTRPTSRDTQTWRRRKCLKCNELFTTYEKVDLSYVIVIKKKGKRQRFDRAKMFSGIYEACYRMKDIDRGDAAVAAEDVAQAVEQLLVENKVKEITTKEIVKIVQEKLWKYPSARLNYLAYFSPKDI